MKEEEPMVTVTIFDKGEEGCCTKMEFNPPLDPEGDMEDLPNAQALGLAIADFLNGLNEGDGTVH